MEGHRSTSTAGAIVETAGQGIAAAWSARRLLDGTLGRFGSFAYAWSLAVVESIIDSGGVSDISRLLDRIADCAFDRSCDTGMLHSSYADLQAADRRIPQARILALIGR